MTLEASFIIPMVICVFALLIYFSLYLYGRCMLSQDSYILAFRASVADERNGGDDPAGYVNNKASLVAGRKYFGSSFPRFETGVSGKEIRVHGYASARHSAMGRYFLKPQSGWEYEAAGKAKRFEYVKHIRRATRVRDIGQEILDYIGEE
jgi:hypothetical protein